MNAGRTNSADTIQPAWKGLPGALLILAAVTLAVYAVSLGNGFVLDDERIIVKNPQTLSLRSIPDVLFSPDVVKPYYRPLNRAGYLLEHQLFGMNPAGFHAGSILVHLGTAVLLYLLCCRLLGDRLAALAAALLFAVHPANAEAVNFISTRNTLLAAFFSLASLLAFLRARERGVRWPLLAALLFFCGLLSKETAFMLLPLLALYTVMPLPGTAAEQGRVRLPALLHFLLLAVVYFAMRAYSLQGVFGTSVAAEGLFSRLAQNYHIIPQYLGLLLFPADLTVFHSARPTVGLLALPWVTAAVWLLLAAAVWLALRSASRAALFGLVWCVVNYAPIANIVPIPSDPITERFLYLPALGFFIAVGALIAWLNSRPAWRKPLWGVLGLILVLFAILTVQRNREWREDFTLFASGVRNNPQSAEARYNLGTAWRDRGDLAQAVLEWRQSLAIEPAHSDALIQMGTYHALQGDLPKAEQYYNAALAAPRGIDDPDKAMAHYNLGIIREKQGQPRQALQQYEQFLKLVPLNYEEYKADAEQRVERLRAALDATGKSP